VIEMTVGFHSKKCIKLWEKQFSLKQDFAGKFRRRLQDVVLVCNQALLAATPGNISKERRRIFYIWVLEIRCYWAAMLFCAVKFTDFTKKLAASIFKEQEHSSSITSLIWDESHEKENCLFFRIFWSWR